MCCHVGEIELDTVRLQLADWLFIFILLANCSCSFHTIADAPASAGRSIVVGLWRLLSLRFAVLCCLCCLSLSSLSRDFRLLVRVWGAMCRSGFVLFCKGALRAVLARALPTSAPKQRERTGRRRKRRSTAQGRARARVCVCAQLKEGRGRQEEGERHLLAPTSGHRRKRSEATKQCRCQPQVLFCSRLRE